MILILRPVAGVGLPDALRFRQIVLSMRISRLVGDLVGDRCRSPRLRLG